MSDGDQRDGRSGIGTLRRDVMKVVGAGGALGALGGTATANEHDDGTPGGMTDDGAPAEPATSTVHTVRTLIGESTSPDRPADFFYQPTGLHVEPGDVVRFVFETPDHNVTSYHPAFGMQRRIPAGVRPFSSPIMGWDPDSLPDDVTEPPAEPGSGGPGAEEGDEGDGADNGDDGGGPVPSTWLYAFETPGVYDLECAPHEAYGMAMRVVVGDETDAAFETSDADQLPQPRAGPVGFARRVLTDPALEPDAIVDKGCVEWSALEAIQSGGEDGESSTE
ncbi:hypothetical protein HWV07_05085 [Natronomonas salina]|uniref:hypothetical protein n=1 Tax=Natronomonas salina TaxID=1710540 RepID=UPI0015B5B553|nr:hypothetical protein [Natronomonas salina]QLD88438.1 hypothetical protein HWV07_05085 [Natronomonas salina]